MKTDKKIVVFFDEEMYHFLKREAFETQQSMSDLCRNAVKLFYKDEESI